MTNVAGFVYGGLLEDAPKPQSMQRKPFHKATDRQLLAGAKRKFRVGDDDDEPSDCPVLAPELVPRPEPPLPPSRALIVPSTPRALHASASSVLPIAQPATPPPPPAVQPVTTFRVLSAPAEAALRYHYQRQGWVWDGGRRQGFVPTATAAFADSTPQRIAMDSGRRR